MKFGSFILVFLICATCFAQTTQPTAALELRASQAFSRGEYAIALPMLQKLAEQLKDEPDRAGPIREQIRVCEKNIDQQQIAAMTGAEPARTPHAKPAAGQVLDTTIKDLGNFEYDSDKGGNVPADVLALSGSKVRLRGFMIPMEQAEKITQFALVPSLFACCYGQPPQIQHTIVVHCPKGKAVGYHPDEIVVEGVLTVEEKKDEGFIVSLFEVEVDSVKTAPKP